MRLTNTIRDAFIRAAMDDVPKIDYKEEGTKIARAACKAIFEKAFPTLKYEDAINNPWFNQRSVQLPGMLSNMYGTAYDYDMLRKEDLKTWTKLEELSKKLVDQQAERDKLAGQLRAVAYSCTTRKALAAALPEFEKYLPADDPAAIRTLPVIANVVTDFVKAGWPKQNAGKIAAAQAAP